MRYGKTHLQEGAKRAEISPEKLPPEPTESSVCFCVLRVFRR